MLAILLSLGMQTGEIENLPFKIPDVIFPGQREVVLGPLAYRDTVMTVIYSKEYLPEKPSNQFLGPGWDEYPIGNVRWSVKPNTYAQKPCMVLHAEGLYMPKTTYVFNRFKKVTNTLDIRGVLEWWIDPDGTILRQYQRQEDSRGVQTAMCSYDKDSINVLYDRFGKRSGMTLFPGDMDKLQMQFKPMIVAGKVVMPQKEYLVYEPFSGGYSKRKAHVGGHFDGTYLSIKFHGTHVDMDGILAEGPVKTYIDDECDLVQVDLPNDRYIKLGVPPPGKDAKG